MAASKFSRADSHIAPVKRNVTSTLAVAVVFARVFAASPLPFAGVLSGTCDFRKCRTRTLTGAGIGDVSAPFSFARIQATADVLLGGHPTERDRLAAARGGRAGRGRSSASSGACTTAAARPRAATGAVTFTAAATDGRACDETREGRHRQAVEDPP